MLSRIIYNKFTVDLVCCLLMIIATAAIADSYTYQYPPRVTGEQGKLWAFPQIPNNSSRFQQVPTPPGQQYQSRPVEQYNRGTRFVTPEILKSIKQQQIQTQLMPENKQPQLNPPGSPGYYQNPITQRPQYKNRPVEKNNQGFRFVTPEILQSIKQQQTQNQLMPKNQQQLKPRQPIQNYGYPPSGMGLTNQSY